MNKFNKHKQIRKRLIKDNAARIIISQLVMETYM